MSLEVHAFADPGSFATLAGDWLHQRPVEHNLLLTVLEEQQTRAVQSRYWAVLDDGLCAGAAFQSPLSFNLTVMPMSAQAAEALADYVLDTDVSLPGVSGEAAAAAAFARRWVQRSSVVVSSAKAFQLCERLERLAISPPRGQLRQATSADLTTACRWYRAFRSERHMRKIHVDDEVEAWVRDHALWLWDDGAPKAMALARPEVAGVTRLSSVFTAPQHRGRGFAQATVHGLSEFAARAGHRCVLYVDLDNPAANAAYRRVGFGVVLEMMHYHFN